MPLRMAGKREIVAMPTLARPIYQSGEGARFDAAQALRFTACVQPLTGTLQATIYGEKAQHMLLLLTEADIPLAEGMGICVNTCEACDYRVAAPPEKWQGHWRAVLERLA